MGSGFHLVDWPSQILTAAHVVADRNGAPPSQIIIEARLATGGDCAFDACSVARPTSAAPDDDFAVIGTEHTHVHAPLEPWFPPASPFPAKLVGFPAADEASPPSQAQRVVDVLVRANSQYAFFARAGSGGMSGGPLLLDGKAYAVFVGDGRDPAHPADDGALLIRGAEVMALRVAAEGAC